ncbi:MAG: hypothetical protein V1754_06010, partial [Pseudomonadota bacterium]
FSRYTRTLFDKIPELQKITFVGKHNDKIVMNIWLTREQYNSLDLRQVEESVNAFSGTKIPDLMSGNISAKTLEKKAEEMRRKTYRAAFARLPKEQVQLDKTLQ